MSRQDSGFGLRVPVKAGLLRGKQVSITFDGNAIVAFEGETVASSLLAAGIRTLRVTHRNNAVRGMFCGIGVCFDCLVIIDGEPSCLACKTPTRDGMCVEIQHGNGDAS